MLLTQSGGTRRTCDDALTPVAPVLPADRPMYLAVGRPAAGAGNRRPVDDDIADRLILSRVAEVCERFGVTLGACTRNERCAVGSGVCG